MDSLRAYNYRQSPILTGTLKPRERVVEKDLAGSGDEPDARLWM
jgi:hypothetical protein